MTAPEVQFVLEQIDTYYGYGALAYPTGAWGSAPPLELVDRDNSTRLDGSIRSRSHEFDAANLVGAALVSEEVVAIGTEYDHDVERVVGLRVEGAHVSEFGHVDPDGVDGAPWSSLLRTIRSSLEEHRRNPSVGRPDTTYHTLVFRNPSPQSDNYSDYYRYDVDLVFQGYEELRG